MLADAVSEEVVTAMRSPVKTAPGFETPLAMTCTVAPAAMVQPPATVSVTVAPALLVTQLSSPQLVAVVTS